MDTYPIRLFVLTGRLCLRSVIHSINIFSSSLSEKFLIILEVLPNLKRFLLFFISDKSDELYKILNEWIYSNLLN